MRKTIDTVENFWNLSQLKTFSRLANQRSRTNFIGKFSDFLGVKNAEIELKASGSDALTDLLTRRKNNNKTVLAPAFNCGTVKQSIINSGCKVLTYDFSETPGKVDWSAVVKLMEADVSVIIVTHFFGLPTDFSEIIPVCQKKGIAIIEDCAHTLGGKIGNDTVGTIGDASIFSFNYDKPISLCGGGLLVINNPEHFLKIGESSDHDHILTDELNQLKKVRLWYERRKKFIKYERSLPYRFYKKLFGLKAPSNRLNTLSAIQAEIGIWSLEKFSDTMQQRNANAEELIQCYMGPTWYQYPNTSPSFLRAKLGIHPDHVRKNIIRKFRKKGIRADILNWPYTINDSPDQSNEITMDATKNWVDIPVHQNLTEEDIETIKNILAQT